MSGWIEGELDPYWEQGWEGSFRYSLSVVEASAPYFLETGDLLDILDADSQLLWSGTFQLRKRRFWERHKLDSKVYSETVLKGLSYRQWMQWLWSNPRLKSRVLRPEEEHQIVYAWQDRHRQRPLRLRDAGPERCLDREIVEWSVNLGSYGMGGPGFFGLRLKERMDLPTEWFSFTLWNAGCWLLLNERWLSAHPRYYELQEPLYSDFGESQSWDGVTSLLEGAVVKNLEIAPSHFTLGLIKGGKSVSIQLPQETERLPRFGGTDLPRLWNPSEDSRDAWVFHESDLYC